MSQLSPFAGRSRLVVDELAFTRSSGDLFGPLGFQLARDETLGVIGPTGGGKADLFALLSGKEIPRAGSITLEGERIDGLSSDARARLGLITVNGPAPAIAGVTLHDWLKAAMLMVDRPGWRLLFDKRLTQDQQKDIRDILAFCRLTNIAYERLSTLTPGQLQMAEIARGLCQRPNLLLLNRPFAGLSRAHRRDFSLIISDIAKEGVALIIADEQLDILNTICERYLVLQRGHLVASGTLTRLSGDPAARQAFTGMASAEAA